MTVVLTLLLEVRTAWASILLRWSGSLLGRRRRGSTEPPSSARSTPLVRSTRRGYVAVGQIVGVGDRPVDPTGRESADRRIVPRMSTDDSTPSTAPDGSTENITDEQKAYADDLPDGKKAGLVDDDKDSESTDD
jgi:hypothetical protein